MISPDARVLLSDIAATPRPAGSAAEARARSCCSSWLEASGFTVEQQPFAYSAWPGAWGTPVVGVLLSAIAVAAITAIVVERASLATAAGAAVAALVPVGLLAWWVARHGARLLPFMRRTAVNLQATRGVPTVWLVAHLDSKSQPISLLTRAAAVVAVVLGWTGAIIACVLSWAAPVPESLVVAPLVLMGIAAIPLAVSWVGTASDGALDNASGVVSILCAARLVDLAAPIGVVVTSAEEFGLAGAREWVRGRSRATAINCDGVDDQGGVTITAGRSARRLWRSESVRRVLGAATRTRYSLPGVLLDSTAFVDAGWIACTVSKGTQRSLARVHTTHDTLEQLSGDGIDEVSRVIASLAEAIISVER